MMDKTPAVMLQSGHSVSVSSDYVVKSSDPAEISVTVHSSAKSPDKKLFLLP